MKRYLINLLTSQDLDEIADRFTLHNIEAGERFFQDFARRCQQLVNFPNMGRSYAEIRPDLRGLPLDGYKGENSYGAYVPDLPGCVAVGETLPEVKTLIQEAIALHLEAMKEEGLSLQGTRFHVRVR